MAMQWVTVAILARLLSPNDFGLVGIAMIVIGFVILFKDLGTSASVIQRKNLSESLLSSLFWVNAGFGIIATIVLFLISPLIGIIYNEPEVTSLLRVLSLTFLIAGFGIIHQAILERNIQFNKIAQMEMCATALGSVVGIVSAISGYGAWSIVYQVIVTTLTTTILLWAFCRWRPRAIFHMNEVREISNYSLNLTGFNIFNYITRNADNILISYFLGPEALGYYNLAYRLMLYPLMNVTWIFNRIMFPIYSQLQDDNARFRKVYLKTVGAIAFVTFPLMIGMMALREPLVLAVFGEKWRPVILLILILAPVGMVQSIRATTGAIFQAMGRTEWLFRWGICTGILTVLSFIVGINWGIIGVAVAYAIVTAVLLYPHLAIPYSLINLPVRDLVTVLWRPVLSCLVMLVLISIVRIAFSPSVPVGFTFGALVSFGAIVYIFMSWVINPNQLKTVLAVFGVRS